MAARPDASTLVRSPHPLVLALAALAAAATLAAACSGMPQSTDPTVTTESDGSTPSPDDTASKPVEADDQARGWGCCKRRG